MLNITEVTLHSAFEDLLGVPGAEFASNLAGGSADSSLSVATPFAGTESMFCASSCKVHP